LVGIIEELSFTTVRHRLAAFLLRQSRSTDKCAGDEPTVTLPASNQELAAQIGTVRELVSRNLSRFQSEGLIRLEGRKVVLLDEEGLKQELNRAG
jgi:CRP/FNR family transcriptional regulator